MTTFSTKELGPEPDVLAPDGAQVRLLAELTGGSMAHFRLLPGQVSRAVTHRTVEEIWYFVEGSGQLWRSLDGVEETTKVRSGMALTIPLGTVFQFRADPTTTLGAVAITMPPWPGEDEADLRTGPWEPTG
jgi:mannose-6-phosphate isomerase-like protein (cupin superfamily)